MCTVARFISEGVWFAYTLFLLVKKVGTTWLNVIQAMHALLPACQPRSAVIPFKGLQNLDPLTTQNVLGPCRGQFRLQTRFRRENHYNCSRGKILSKLAKAKRGASRIRRQYPERFLGNSKSFFIAFFVAVFYLWFFYQ